MIGVCHHCDSAPSNSQRFGSICVGCAHRCSRDETKRRAHSAVSLAVARGQLPRAKELVCLDCGGPANDWDHRDYAKPLEVEPVCRSCNLLRGPALNGPNHPLTLAALYPGVWPQKRLYPCRQALSATKAV